MTAVRWERYPLVAAHADARAWLQIQADLGLARNTVEAYGRALQEYLTFSARAAVAAETAGRAHIAAYVGDLTARPSPRGARGRGPDAGTGLANATLQQRLVVIRLFYDYLIEEGGRITQSAAAATPPVRVSAVRATVACSRATRNCRGSHRMRSGGWWWRRRGPSHCATG